MISLRPFAGLLLLLSPLPTHAAGPEAYHLVWDSPSKDHHGSMPLGNGDISVNAWIEPSGALVFYIGKTDSWDDNSRLLKIGKVRVTLDPAPTVTPFRQELSLADGSINVRYGDGTTLRVWVDANHPVIHVTADAPRPVTATATAEHWRTAPFELPSIECSDVMTDRSMPNMMHAPTVVEPDTVLKNLPDRIGWFHHNIKSVGPALHAETQGMSGYPRPDPLLHRTFGALITGTNAKRLDDTHLQSPIGTAHGFNVHVLTQHPSTPEAWTKAADALVATTASTPMAPRRQAHEAWWREFWQRSWIHVTQSAATPGASLPANKLPILTGRDQTGSSRFLGELTQASLTDRALTPAEIAARAATRPDPASPTPLLPRDGQSLPASVTIEAWIKPTPGSSGRIVDNITPGAADGFLLDILPGNTLRFIVGRTVLAKPNCVTPDQWHHVAATAAGSALRLFLDGKPVAESNLADGDDAFTLSRGYAMQRFITACAGRGAFPIKFNGSLFTVPAAGCPGDADYRAWGPGYWWQNTRLPYISLCATGDYEMLEPLFRLYVDDFLPLNQYRTKHYFGIENAAYYIECMDFWGDVFNESYGWQPRSERQDPLQQSGYHKWEWVAGPELVWMMLDAYDHTLDRALLEKRLLPTADAVIRFFDGYYKTNEQGQLVMHPSQALETWWDCTNPMPELAGLHAITTRLLALPETATTPAARAFWRTFAAKLAPLPVRDTPTGKALAPATQFADKRNCENPELYAVFPFRLCSFEKPNRDLGLQALRHRWDSGNSGWRQDDLFMAYLGLADEARQAVTARARSHDANSRFPAFWGPNFDWVPDQDHGGVLMKATQAMLLQTEAEKIFLLPAWPKTWDVSFRLHAPGKTIIEGEVKDGKLIRLETTPPERQQDLVLPSGWQLP